MDELLSFLSTYGITIGQAVQILIGAIAVIITTFSLGYTIGVKVAESKPKEMSLTDEELKLFDLSREKEEADFYDELSKSIRNAEREIYRSGRGFFDSNDKRLRYARDLLNATGDALNKGVKIRRIQTSQQAIREWANSYAELVDKQSNLAVYLDVSNPTLVNIGVVDPRGKNPIVQLLFESREFSVEGDNYENAVAVFIFGKKELARNIRQQFILRMRELEQMTSDDVRNLGVDTIEENQQKLDR